MMVRLMLSSRSLQRSGGTLRSSGFGFNVVVFVHFTFLFDLAAKMQSCLRVRNFFLCSSIHLFISFKNVANHACANRKPQGLEETIKTLTIELISFGMDLSSIRLMFLDVRALFQLVAYTSRFVRVIHAQGPC